MSPVSLLQNLRIVLRKIRWQKRDGPAEQRGIWKKLCTQFEETWIRTEPHSSLSIGGLVVSYAIHNSTSGETFCRSKKDLNSAELETVRVSMNPRKSERPVERCKRTRKQCFTSETSNFDVTVQLFEDTPPVLSRAHLCEDHGGSSECTNGRKPHLIKQVWKIPCNTENYVPVVVPGLSREASVPARHPMPISSSSQDSSRESSTQRPGERRTKRERILARRNSSRDLEAKERDNLARGDLSHHLPERPEGFTEELVD